MRDVEIKLVSVGETSDDDITTTVYAEVNSVGRDEFTAAGQMGIKASYQFKIWLNEYEGQDEVEYNGKRYSIYRTYEDTRRDKIELYTEERIGNGN